MTRRHVCVVILYGLMIFGIKSEVLAKQGFYMGLGIPYNTIGGDFDGKSSLIGANDLIILPEIDGGLGLGILLGYGFTKDTALELSYFGTSHNAKFLGGSGDVDYNVLNLDLKFSFLTEQPTQPYLLFGLGFNQIAVKDGSVNLFTGQVGDGTFTGVGFNLGAGVDHYFTPNISLGAGLIYRIVRYDEAEGVTDSGSIDSKLNGDGFGLVLSTAYHF